MGVRSEQLCPGMKLFTFTCDTCRISVISKNGSTEKDTHGRLEISGWRHTKGTNKYRYECPGCVKKFIETVR